MTPKTITTTTIEHRMSANEIAQTLYVALFGDVSGSGTRTAKFEPVMGHHSPGEGDDTQKSVIGYRLTITTYEVDG